MEVAYDRISPTVGINPNNSVIWQAIEFSHQLMLGDFFQIRLLFG